MSSRFKELQKALMIESGVKYLGTFITQKYLLDLYLNYKKDKLKIKDNVLLFVNADFKTFMANTKIFTQDKQYYNEKASKIILDYFSDFETEETIEKDSDHIKKQDDENTKVDNIVEFDENKLMPKRVLQLYSLQAIISKKSNFDFILNTDLTLQQELDTTNLNTVSKVSFEITKQITTGETNGLKFITEYKFKCPRCAIDLVFKPYEIHQNIKHACEGRETSTGKQSFQEIKMSGKQINDFCYLYLYEAKFSNKDDTCAIYSFKNDLLPGKYVADIYVCTGAFENKSELLILMLGFERQKPKVSEQLIFNNDALSWCSKKKLPHIKALNVLFSIRKLHEKYTLHQISDKGFLLQFFVTMSGLAKQLFNYRILAINVVGNRSLGKTYSGFLFAMALDRNFKFIQHSSDVSLAGLKGGINNKYYINGQAISIFEQGIFTTGGLTLIDEAAMFFDRKNLLLNEALKSLPDKTITIQKIGGAKGIPQNYTPILFSNFTDFSSEYCEAIESDYFRLNNKSSDEEKCPYHKPDKISVTHYLRKIDLYLPLDYYVKREKNYNLARAISFVRDKYTKKDIDWKTGGSLASDSRFLFSLVVKNQQEKLKEDEAIKAKFTKLVLPNLSDIPYEEFIEEIKAYYDIKINLYDNTKNTKEQNEQLNLLRKNIELFLETDGKKIFLHLSNNSKEIESKTNSILFDFIIMLQLLEDKNSVKLSDNIKVWCHLILLKCKRGISEGEYNFDEHIEFEQHNFDDIRTAIDIESAKNAESAELLARKLLEEKAKKETFEEAKKDGKI